MKIFAKITFFCGSFLLIIAAQRNSSNNPNHPIPTPAATKVDNFCVNVDVIEDFWLGLQSNCHISLDLRHYDLQLMNYQLFLMNLTISKLVLIF